MPLRAAFPYLAFSWLAAVAFLVGVVPVMAVVGEDPASTAAALGGGVLAFLALGLATIGCFLFGDAPRDGGRRHP